MSYCTDNLSASQRQQIASQCFQVVEQRGDEIHGLCPFHNEKKPSFSYNIQKDTCNCFSCGASGDLVVLWGQAHGYVDNKEAFAAFKAAHGSDTPTANRRPKTWAQNNHGGQGGETHYIAEDKYQALEPLAGELLKAAHSYTWSDKTIQALGLRQHNNRIAIPIRQDDGAIVNIRLYAPGASDNKIISWGKGYGKNKLYPNPASWRKTGPILLCEGEKDTITAIGKGFNACTQTAGCNSWADQFTRFFSGRDVVIAYDADEKGQTGAIKVSEKLAKSAKSIKIITWPADIMPMQEDHGQDLTDYFARHNKTAQDLRDLIANTTTKKSTDNPRVDDDVKRFFGGERGTQFKPRLVADEIASWRKLIYDAKSGMYYTWTDTHWQEYDPANIRHHALQLLKIEGTTPRVNDVLGIVRDLAIMPHGRKMNDRDNHIPILNGMFDITAGQITEHDPDNLNTYIIDLQIDTSNLPDCPLWKQFLNESIADQDTIRELQKFFGYCLTRETRHEKALLLIGPGGDGKGTILKILQALIGEVNTANVTMGGLQDQFHRVMLVDKLLNVATEVEANLLQSDIFKTLISGESVTAAYKHKNAFSFLPVCKLAFSANKHPNIQDTSDGLYRRLLLIEMEKQFVKQGKADIYLLDKLHAERAGIFMWALAGLQMLQKEEFTPSKYMDKCLDNFQELNNPILSFTRTHVQQTPDAWTCTMDVYNKYRHFCEKRGYKAMGESRFGVELRKICPYAKKKRETSGKRRWGYINITLEDDYATI